MPPSIGTCALHVPSAATVVVAVVVANVLSVFVAATYTVFPGAEVPVTVTGDPATAAWSAGCVTVRVVVPCVCWT